MTKLSEKDIYYEVALYRLNNEFKDPIFAKNGSLDTLTQDQVTLVQDSIIDGYIQQDRFKVYHVSRTKKDMNFGLLEKAIEENKFRYDFLWKKDFSEWSVKGKKLGKDHYEFSFSKFHKKSIKNPDETKVGVTPLITIPYYFQFIAEFNPENGQNIVTLSFPGYRPNPYGTYEFDQEINYFYSWVINFDLELIKVDCKEIFDSLDDAKFDKFGFKGEDLKSENSFVKSIFQLKHNQKSQHSQAMHEAIDNIIKPEMVDLIMAGIEEVSDEIKFKIPENALARARSYFESIQFSKTFFNAIHKGCEYGVGFAKHTRSATETFEYNLEYTKTGQGLIRSRTEKWNTFEPLYNEIVKNLK